MKAVLSPMNGHVYYYYYYCYVITVINDYDLGIVALSVLTSIMLLLLTFCRLNVERECHRIVLLSLLLYCLC